ncbi:MAG: GFA family protein [Rhizobiales bacterium]|nr:GFA family protein [Hyphomicrobiales bacterium]
MTGFAGGCLCGRLRYDSDGPALTAVNCYCTDCRKAGGAPMTHVVLRPADLRTTGESAVYESTADSGGAMRRRFCPVCGATTTTDIVARGLITVNAATLDDSSWVAAKANLWVRSRPAWAPLDPTLPTHEKGFPPRA